MKLQSAIEQMYYGKRGQGQLIRASAEEQECWRMVEQCRQEILNKIEQTPEIEKLFDDLDEAVYNACGEEAQQHYAAGFRFGVLMGLDIANGD